MLAEFALAKAPGFAAARPNPIDVARAFASRGKGQVVSIRRPRREASETLQERQLRERIPLEIVNPQIRVNAGRMDRDCQPLAIGREAWGHSSPGRNGKRLQVAGTVHPGEGPDDAGCSSSNEDERAC